MPLYSPPAMHSDRAMVFVDGSNLLIEMGSLLGSQLRADCPTVHEIRLASQTVQRTVNEQVAGGPIGKHRFVRWYWFGSVQGSEELLIERQAWLREERFDAVLFKKPKNKRNEKGVDLAVAREMLMHGFNRNYDTAVLVAGDEDYLGLVQDLKRLGLRVVGAFYSGKSLSPSLKLACDWFVDLNSPDNINSELAQLARAGTRPHCTE